MSYPIGIDLGTTYSAVSYVDEHGTPRVIPDSEENYVIPSVVLFEDGCHPAVGGYAKDSISAFSERVVVGVKRHMGDMDWTFEVDGRSYNPADVSAMILGHLKSVAEAAIGPVRDAVITVPAYFLDKERTRTIEAATKAGLNVLGIVNEPTAAALSYCVGAQPGEQTLLVYDLGGGTFDVTIMRYSSRTEPQYQVVTTRGDHHLGGIDWDMAIANVVDERFRSQHGASPMSDSCSRADLLAQCEKAKRALTNLERTNLVFHYQGRSLTLCLERSEFEAMTQSLLSQTETEVDLGLADAGLTMDQVDLVLLVGGSCKMPMVARAFSARARQVTLSRDPDLCVSLGAAIQAARLALTGGLSRGRYHPAAEDGLRRISVADVVPHSLGLVVVEDDRLRNKIVLSRNAKVPCEASRTDLTTLRDNQTSVEVHIVQGESENPHGCFPLESYVFDGIPPRPAGKTRLKITYRYNANTVVEVTALDVDSNQKLSLKKRSMDDIRRVLDDDLKASSGGGERAAVLTMDASYSMHGNRLAEAKAACKSFLDKTDFSRVRVALVQFGMEPKASIVVPLSGQAEAITAGVARIEATGSTPMAEGIDAAVNALAEVGDMARYIILFTDGEPDNEDAAVKAATRAKERGIEVICIGTAGANQVLLGKMSTTQEDSYFAADGSAIKRTFGDLAEVISNKRLA